MKLLETTHAETSGMRDELQKHIGDIYKKLLSHQMKSICSLFRGTATTIARYMMKRATGPTPYSRLETPRRMWRDIDTFP